jgi:hypothetical protein
VLVDQGANVLVARQLGHADPSASLRNLRRHSTTGWTKPQTRLDEAIAPWSECWAAVQSALRPISTQPASWSSSALGRNQQSDGGPVLRCHRSYRYRVDHQPGPFGQQVAAPVRHAALFLREFTRWPGA